MLSNPVCCSLLFYLIMAAKWLQPEVWEEERNAHRHWVPYLEVLSTQMDVF